MDDSTKKREWWITSLRDNDDGPDVLIEGPNADQVHVVEFYAFEALQRELDRVKAIIGGHDIGQCDHELTTANARISELENIRKELELEQVEHIEILGKEYSDRIAELEADVETHGVFASKFGDLSGCYDAEDVTRIIQTAFDDQKDRIAELELLVRDYPSIRETNLKILDHVSANLKTASVRIAHLEAALSFLCNDEHVPFGIREIAREALKGRI